MNIPFPHGFKAINGIGSLMHKKMPEENKKKK